MKYGYVPSDIAVFAEDQALILLVEVKRADPSSPEWAAKVRRDTLDYRRNVPPYFLVVAPDAAYLWSGTGDQPDYILNIEEILRHYVERIGSTTRKLGRDALELTAGIWLRDLTIGIAPPEATEPLRPTGLLEEIDRGRIEFPAFA